MNNPAKRFYGKYKATVVEINDPEQRGRIMVSVPDLGPTALTTWAEACVPLAGTTVLGMGIYAVPPIGAPVWVEFERGSPDHPIWVGCRYPSAGGVPSGVPPELPSGAIVLRSFNQHSIVINDLDLPGGSIVLQILGGPSLRMDATGITLSSGIGGTTISLTDASIAFNQDAMTILP